MSVNASFDGVQITDLANWTFSGSSSPIAIMFPNCTGALLKPSGRKNAILNLVSNRFVATDKTTIEQYQHDLNECLIFHGNSTLVVNGIVYTNVTPLSVSQNILTTNEYMSYTISFQLDQYQAMFKPTINDGRVRNALFTAYGGECTEFPVFDNFEAGMNVAYDVRDYPRVPYAPDIRRVPVHGVEVISLECWMVDQTANTFQMYMSDWLKDPLGKQGTLNLNGNVYNNAILTNVNSSIHVSRSMTYNLEFTATLAC